MKKFAIFCFFVQFFAFGVCYSELLPFKNETTSMDIWAVTSAINDNGKIVVSWAAADAANNQYAKAAIYDGSSWLASSSLGANTSAVWDMTCAINDNGEAIVAWRDYNSSTGQYYAQAAIYKYDGSIWQWTTFSLGANASYVGAVTCAINDSGEAIVSWRVYDGTFYYALASIYKYDESIPGWKWTTTDLNANNSYVYDITCSINNSGKAIVAWTDAINSTFYAQAAIYDGSSWPLAPTSLGANTLKVWNVICAMNDNGKAIVVWADKSSSTGYCYVQAALYDGSSWSLSPNSLGANTADVWCVKCAINDDGKAIVAWADSISETGYCCTQAAIYDGSSWPVAPSDLKAHTSFIDNINCAINNTGEAVVAWTDLSVSTFFAQSAIYKYDGSIPGWDWTTASLHSYTSNVWSTTCDINDSGKVIVAWADLNGRNSNTRVAIYDGSSWPEPTSLGAHIRNIGYLICAINNSGKAIVTWEDYDRTTTLYHSQVSIYDGSSWPLAPTSLETAP